RAMAARRRPNTVGVSTLLGAEGEAREDVGPGGGLVMVDGALWQAHSLAPIHRGSRVHVTAVSGLQLTVEP
ncbi:MAG TPA: NfeD family protein, partial [Candidatus Dormibacteraeota bacterium]|nr:NfeD family protein [Candidatus Dormibacteraeota bacterium]